MKEVLGGTLIMAYKKVTISLISLFLIFSGVGCKINKDNQKYRITDMKQVVKIAQLHSGDAKFFKDHIITNVGGALTVIDLDGNIQYIYDGINANWIDVIDKENILVYGNFNNEIGMVKFDDNYNVVSNDIIMNTDNLQIDPAISVMDGVYYMTVTEIIGNINNSDKNEENGEYILHLYQSRNLKEWTLVSDIVDDSKNIEDVDIMICNHDLYVIYEKEEIDRGKSAIVLKRSEDRGKSWSNEIELLSAEADQEPAGFLRGSDDYILYYSSDKEFLGESYEGASVYYSTYDVDFNLILKNQLVSTEADKGILLYDITELDGNFYILYAQNYLSTNNLVIEKAE